MANNGSSYQKDQSNSSPYEAVDSGATGGAKKWILGAALVVIVGVVGLWTTNQPAASVSSSIVAEGYLPTGKDGKLKLFDDEKRFLLEDYDAKSTFASFLPGVAGYYGKPVWAFYVNRGQAISTFGTESKDYPILEFNAANKAYQVTSFIGFRTFVRGTRSESSGSFQVEPFAPRNSRNLLDANDDPDKPKRILYVGTNEVEIQEIDSVHGLTTNVKYFILPEEDFASMIRRTTLTNTGDDTMELEILDGLAKIEPSGGRLDGMLKSMGRTLEGWFGVYHADDTLAMPFYKMSTEPGDTAKVTIEEHGHYCLSFIESEDEDAELLPIVYDPNKVFGKSTTLEHPAGFFASSVGEILDGPQYGDAKTSSSFAAVRKIKLKAGESVTIASVYGKAGDVTEVPKIAKVVTSAGYIDTKFKRARNLMNELTASVETTTVNPLFDGTVKQMFLDNSLRGGMPTILGNVDADTTYDEDPGVKIFHSFSRIHGDLERDYNAFMIEPAFFSQGPGNYRDVAQNRRNDVTFVPRMAGFDVEHFLSFIQADGYEPLTVEAVVYLFRDESVARSVAQEVTTDEQSAKVLGDVLSGGPFRPGQIFSLCEMLKINRVEDNDAFLNPIIAAAEDRAMAQYGSGYWGDHWDYYLDLIEAYLGVFPDGEEALMYDNHLRYFFSTATVRPRCQKYVVDLTFDGSKQHVIQLESTYYDMDKAAEQEQFRNKNTGLIGIDAQWQRDSSGKPFTSTPISKLFLLVSIKYAMRDAWGMGIEYEGGRPGWLDSMNGLPGMVGSGMPETYELYLLMQYVKKVVDSYGREVEIPVELDAMLKKVEKALDTLLGSGYEDAETLSHDVPQELFEYWDSVATAREDYRAAVEYYFSGETVTYSAKKISKMTGRWLEQIEAGMERSLQFGSKGYGDDGESGIPPAFFSYDITDWVENGNYNSVGLPLANATAMSVGVFPLFLEGPVRYMKTIQDDPDKMIDMYERVLDSGLRDNELGMYYLSASLKGQTYDMGRQIAFAPGWLENQSIWMHMSYKYYLQLIRGKLYDKFFSEMKDGGVLPFMDPEVYGRPLYECSSFIASSAFPDPSVHGQGFLARLSGSTAEFMDMWKEMFIGPELFYVNEDSELKMHLMPALPSWLFKDETVDNDPMLDEDGAYTVSFKLFASIEVTYHNPGAQDLLGKPPKSYKVTMADGSVEEVEGGSIPTELAKKIRRMTAVDSIDAYF